MESDAFDSCNILWVQAYSPPRSRAGVYICIIAAAATFCFTKFAIGKFQNIGYIFHLHVSCRMSYLTVYFISVSVASPEMRSGREAELRTPNKRSVKYFEIITCQLPSITFRVSLYAFTAHSEPERDAVNFGWFVNEWEQSQPLRSCCNNCCVL
jgi:hypothetical protein